MKKYIPIILLTLASTASASTVQENLKLSHLQKASPDAHDVVIEINYRLAEKCNSVLSVDKIVASEPLFSFLIAMRSVDKDAFSTKPYKYALDGIECDDISAGIPK